MAPTPTTTTHAPSPQVPHSPSSLSPDAHPFFPSGRSKSQRWEHSSPVISSAGTPPPLKASFHDVLLSRPAQAELELKLTYVVPPLCSLLSGRPLLYSASSGEFEWLGEG
jgi:hypothetical protein